MARLRALAAGTGNGPEPGDWSGRTVSGECLESARLAGLIARGTDWNTSGLAGADLSRMDGRRSSWGYMGVTGARFDGADLTRSRFSYCDFEDASLRGARLRGCQFRYCDLTKCDLRDIDWRWARLEFCDLTKARLEGGRNIWGVHAIIGEHLRRAARGRPDRLGLSQVAAMGCWCWGRFAKMDHAATEWAVEVLGGLVRSGDHLPRALVARLGGGVGGGRLGQWVGWR